MKERRTRWHLIAWWTEVVVQRTRKWRQSGRETLASHEVGRASVVVRSLHELEWRKEKGGGSGTGTRARIESQLDVRKRGSA